MNRTRQEIFEIWVPDGGLWSPWGIPVLFTQLPAVMEEQSAHEIEVPPPATWCPRSDDHCAIVLDLPGPTSVTVGLSLAKVGFRPVPLFNGCYGDHAVIDQRPIMRAICGGTEWLSAQRLREDAPPAFLLDSGRMNGLSPVTPGMFDNRWKIFPQDFPAAEFLLQQELRRCLVVQQQQEIAEDLCHILRRWQVAGLPIHRQLTSQAGAMLIEVPEPPKYHSLGHRAATEEGKYNLQGGFGFIVPEPRSG